MEDINKDTEDKGKNMGDIEVDMEDMDKNM